MKASELMVGDYLTFPDVKNDSNCPKLRVVAINEEDVYVSNDGDPVADLYDPKELSGIPLAPYILEKNGFVFVEGWWEIPRLPNGYGYVAIAFDPDGKGRPTNTIYDLDVSQKESGSADLHLNYVHELQHALRLCGIEKEIIL